MTLPPRLAVADLTAVTDQVDRARLLAREAHAGQTDKAGVDYFTGHLTDVWRRAVAYGADTDEQAAALLHDVVEDTDVTDEDLWNCGFTDRTVLIVHLMTKRPPETDGVYYARLRAYEPARRLKLDADIASNSDPDRLALVPEPKRSRLAAKYAKATLALTPAPPRAGEPAGPQGHPTPTPAPADRPALVLLPKDNPFAAANALRALGGAPPLPHEVNTLGEDRDGGFVWFSECTCSWRGPDRTHEFTADLDRLGHSDEHPSGV